MSDTETQLAGTAGDRDPVPAALPERVAAARALLPRIQAGEDAREQARVLVAAARAASDGDGECAALYSAMAASALQGDVAGSRAVAAEMAERGAELKLPAWEAVGRQYVARMQLGKGHEDLALNQLVAAELLLDDAPVDVALVVALNGIAVAYSRTGLYEDGERTFDRLAEVVDQAGDTWAVRAFVHNRLLNEAAWGVSLEMAGIDEVVQDRLASASVQARQVIDMAGTSAEHDFGGVCLFADLLSGQVSLEEARAAREPILEHALGEPQSYLRFGFAHQFANVGRWDEAREEVEAGLAAANPAEREPIRSALMWERARIAVLEHPEHRGVQDVWEYARMAGAQLWRTRQRRKEAVQGKLRVARLQREHDRVERVSLEDPLTGAANRRRIDRERASLLEGSGTVWATVVYLDIDRFKAVNDGRGHELGDAVLRRMAQVLAANVRDGDLVGRYGGDEFVILATHCPPADAEQLGQRLLAAVRTHPWDELQPGLAIRVSMGLAVSRTQLAQLFPVADAALYRAKRGGRDRVELVVLDDEEAPAGTGHLRSA